MDFTAAVAFLFLTIVMPPDKPDINSPPIPKDSIEECVSEATMYLNRGVTDAMREHGAVGVVAACGTGYKVKS